LSRRVALLLAALASAPASARAGAAAPAREAELRTCMTHLEWVAPPGAVIADRAAFCGCYADSAVRAGLRDLERAEANPGQEVRQPVADRTIRLHDRKSAAVAAACLKR
jgi:hypothetical protein